MSSKSVVLLSGGIDSLVVAAHEHRAGHLTACLFVHYGQPAGAPEHEAAKQWCNAWHIPFYRLDIGLHGLSAMTALTGAPGPRVVPGRNLVLLAHACNLAATIGAGRVLYGATAADDEGYPDCRPAFVAAADRAARACGVAIEAPLINLSKAAVLAEAKRLGLNLDAAWSCYTPIWQESLRKWVPCGTCDSCCSRSRGLEEST